MTSQKEMASKLKRNVICDFPEQYEIADELRHGFSDIDLRIGIKNLSSLLLQIFDAVLSTASESVPSAEELTNNINYYADVRNPLTLLYCMGLCGKLNEISGELLVDGSELNKAYKKLGGTKPIECMHLLQDSGVSFSSDISAKSFSLNKAGIIKIDYPDDSHTLKGLKIMAEAASRVCDNNSTILFIFARCDYHALSLPKKYSFSLNDVTNFLSAEYRSYFFELHEFLLANNCKYDAPMFKFQAKNIGNAYTFTYTSKARKAVVCSIYISMHNTSVKINSYKINEEPELLADAPQSIKDAVIKGHGCAKEHDQNACNPKCVGKNHVFKLDGTEYVKCRHLNFTLPITQDAEREYVKTWLNKELA